MKFENFRNKSHSAENKPKDPLVSLVFWKHKKLWFSARIERTLSGFNKLVEVEQIVKSGQLRVRLSTEKKLLTVIDGLFSLREKAPTKKDPPFPNGPKSERLQLLDKCEQK